MDCHCVTEVRQSFQVCVCIESALKYGLLSLKFILIFHLITGYSLVYIPYRPENWDIEAEIMYVPGSLNLYGLLPHFPQRGYEGTFHLPVYYTKDAEAKQCDGVVGLPTSL